MHENARNNPVRSGKPSYAWTNGYGDRVSSLNADGLGSKTVLSPILPLHDLPPKRPHGMIRMQACICMIMGMVAYFCFNRFDIEIQK